MGTEQPECTCDRGDGQPHQPWCAIATAQAARNCENQPADTRVAS